MRVYDSSAPVPISRCGPPPAPMVGMVSTPTIFKVRGRARSGPLGHGVADVLVQLGQGDGSQYDLIGRGEPLARQEGGLHRRARPLAEDGDDLSVDVQVVGVRARPRQHGVVVVEEPGGEVVGDVPRSSARGQDGVPVPSVQAGVRHERIEAGGERDRGYHDDDGQGRSQDGRAHRHGVAPHAGLERESHPGHRRRREAERTPPRWPRPNGVPRIDGGARRRDGVPPGS